MNRRAAGEGVCEQQNRTGGHICTANLCTAEQTRGGAALVLNRSQSVRAGTNGRRLSRSYGKPKMSTSRYARGCHEERDIAKDSNCPDFRGRGGKRGPPRVQRV
ncbi:hypothetical protein MCOR27_002610 [Pyricularia oryzae]|nr:hypothetical protein MCOR01_007222 [Pyricularia oryzae]KAI6284624.1 hypothetical protein MCOR27_002610 [Pyricularia oryzae]KAI6286377.1 hypothetical protein MCOR26_001078 [Pyricularia oryzae]KAI6314120.1 hypothetical protein MCOR29_007459 [Pyricularia oryzae]KAI6330292.1 hypothetical protein MCOR28_011684 [Pyricularia oryzae]